MYYFISFTPLVMAILAFSLLFLASSFSDTFFLALAYRRSSGGSQSAPRGHSPGRGQAEEGIPQIPQQAPWQNHEAQEKHSGSVYNPFLLSRCCIIHNHRKTLLWSTVAFLYKAFSLLISCIFHFSHKKAPQCSTNFTFPPFPILLLIHTLSI